MRIAQERPDTAFDDLSYRHALNSARRDVITRALTHTQGNRTAAALEIE